MDKFKKLDQLIEQVLAERAYPIADFPAKFRNKTSKDQYNKDVDDIQTKIGSLATNAPDEKVVDKVDANKLDIVTIGRNIQYKLDLLFNNFFDDWCLYFFVFKF